MLEDEKQVQENGTVQEEGKDSVSVEEEVASSLDHSFEEVDAAPAYGTMEADRVGSTAAETTVFEETLNTTAVETPEDTAANALPEQPVTMAVPVGTPYDPEAGQKTGTEPARTSWSPGNSEVGSRTSWSAANSEVGSRTSWSAASSETGSQTGWGTGSHEAQSQTGWNTGESETDSQTGWGAGTGETGSRTSWSIGSSETGSQTSWSTGSSETGSQTNWSAGSSERSEQEGPSVIPGTSAGADREEAADHTTGTDPVREEPKQAGSSGPKGRKSNHMGRRGGNNYLKAILCAVVCGVIVGVCVVGSFAIGKNISATSTTEVTTNEAKLSEASSDSSTDEAETTSSSSDSYTVSEIAENCSSSVVAITSMSVSEVQTMFGVYEYETEGSGSGVIIAQTDTELLIVTNYHVIEDATELTVCFNDDENAVFSASVKGTDSSNDLAVISIALSDIDEDALNSISIATIGDSDSMEVGDQVVAIGNALGLGQSVTTGIVSALGREVSIDDVTYSNLIQTDAAINPGNSGGALFNMQGELIGINSAKYSSDSVEGMGFAIAMSTAQPIIEELMTQETRTKLDEDYGALNITGYTVSEEVSTYYGLPTGVYVNSVTSGGAAENAGIQAGDIITGLNGTEITSIDELQEELQYYAAGEVVSVTLQRNSTGTYEEITVEVTLDNAADLSSSTSSDTETSTESEDGTSSLPGSSDEDSSLPDGNSGYSFR